MDIGFFEPLIVLSAHGLGDEISDPRNVLIPFTIFLSHDPLELVGYLFLYLSPSLHLGPICRFDSMDLRA